MSANIKQVRNLAGELLIQLDGADKFRSAGHMDSFTVTVNPTTEDIYSAISGEKVVEDTDVTELSASGSAVFRQTGTEQLAYAMLANIESLVQSALTGETKVGSAIVGDVVDFDALDITITSITNGVDALVEGEDYELDAQAGLVTFLVDTAYDITYNTASILESANRSYISALSASGGIKARVKLRQKQTRGDTRYVYNALVRIFPDGEAQLHNDAGDKVTVPVRFNVIKDASKPVGKQFGYLQELSN